MDKLKELRGKRTQEFVAKQLNIPRGTYRNYEAGTRQPDQFTLLKIADYYNVSVDYILGRENNSNYLPSKQIIDERLVNELAKEGISTYDLTKLNDTQIKLIANMIKELKNK